MKLYLLCHLIPEEDVHLGLTKRATKDNKVPAVAVQQTEDSPGREGKAAPTGTVQCTTVQYCELQCTKVKYCALQCTTVQYSTVQYLVPSDLGR